MNFSERRELERLLNTDEKLEPKFLAAKFRELATTTPSVGAEEAALGWRLLAGFIVGAPPDTFDIRLDQPGIGFSAAILTIADTVAGALTGKTMILSREAAIKGRVALDIAAGDVVYYRGPILAGLPENQIDVAAAFCGSMKAAAKDPVGFASGFPN